jgi:Uncharacterised nucleotidyltransferase
MTPREFQLLLYCARSRPDAKTIRDLVNHGDVNWQALVALAQQHYVRPMLLRTLKSLCWDAVPQTTKLELEQFNRANVQKNLLFTGELLRLFGLFQQHGIPIATFKGPILAVSVYGDLALREFSDLDLLVHTTDLCKAEDILAACGYQADFPDKDYRSAFVGYQGQYAFRHSKTGISIDLHWRLSRKGAAFPIQSTEIWPRLNQVTIAGRKVPTLANDDLALFLAAHGTKEGWRSLGWVCDFAELLHNCHDIDWAAILERAQRSYSSRMLLLAVFLASTLLDAPAPVHLVDKARSSSAVRALAQKAQFRMLRSDSQEEDWKFLNGLNSHDRFSRRLWPIATLLTTRTVGDYRAMPLPKSLWGIYYLTRPFRLASKAAQMVRRTG